MSDFQSVSGWKRALLPAVEGSAITGPNPRRSARDWAVDIAALALALTVASADLYGYAGKPSPFLAYEGFLDFVACASLWERRAHPLAVGLFTILVSGLASGARVAALLGLFTVAVHCAPRWTARLAGLSVAAVALSTAIYRPGGHYDWRFLEAGVVLSFAVVGYGLYIRVRRELVAALYERARRLETEQELRLSEARHAERLRIAREMHDVLAHRISLLSVNAGALEYSPDAPPEVLAQAAAVIRASARAAQEDLRGVIGVLRDDEGHGARIEPPQPTLADVRQLVDESRQARMDVTCDVHLASGALPPQLGRTIYRIVQEALTNARKHAPGQKVTITITGHPGQAVTVQAVNRPLVGHASGERQLGGSGAGLMGLAERVNLVGGQLTHQALDDGGFTLTATLPWS